MERMNPVLDFVCPLTLPFRVGKPRRAFRCSLAVSAVSSFVPV
jgi:hypothetical protein